MAYEWTMHIDAPPEKVFDVLSDVANHGSWANPRAELKVAEVSAGPPALGSTFRSEQVFAGKAQTAEIEIVEFDRPNRFAFAISQHKHDGGEARRSTTGIRSCCRRRRAAPSSFERRPATATR